MSLIESTELKSLSRYVRGYLGGLRTLCMEIDGEEFKYLEGGEGETVLFLHGMMGSKTQWRSLMRAYREGYRVVAIDVPGLSLRRAFPQNKHTLRQLCDWLEKVVVLLRVKYVHLVCHSFGCALGAYFAATHSDRVQSASFLSFPDLFQRDDTVFNRVVNELLETLESKETRFLQDYYHRYFYNPPTLPGIVLRYNLREMSRYQDQVVKAVREMRDTGPLLMAQLNKIQAPCLMINGTNDVITPLFDSEYWAMKLPTAEFAEIAECGHAMHLEKSADVITLHQAFLDRHKDEKPNDGFDGAAGGFEIIVD